MSIVEYVPGNSIFHRMNPVTKLYMMAVLFVVIMVFFKAFSLLVILFIMIGMWRFSKIPMRYLQFLMILMLATGVTFTLTQGFLYDPPSGNYTGILTLPLPPLYIGGGKNIFVLTLEGVLFGLTMTVKILTLIFVFPLVAITTSITDFVTGLTKLRVPYKFSFTLAIAMRMVPQINSSFAIITDAERVRGVNIEKMNLIQRLRNYVPHFVPLILAMLRSSDTMDIALESRGFGRQQDRTSIDEATFRRIDYISFAVLTAILIYSVISAMLWGQLIPITLPFSL